MRLVSYLNGSSPALAIRIEQELVNLTALGLPASLEEWLSLGENGREHTQRAVASATRRVPLSGIRYLPPLQRPSKAIAVGLNYAEHAAETKLVTAEYPTLFQRYPTSWVGHGAPIIRPTVSAQLDYEGELVVVIGKPGRSISKRSALTHVAGYSIFNEGSIRDYQLRTSQWMIGKNFDRSGAFGPEFVTADELPEGATGLRLQTRLNGKTVQDANTRDMIFDIASLIATCSEACLLNVGDMIITGTPSGVGFTRKPPLFMKSGDLCEIDIEGLGVLSNPVCDEATD
jgi:2-keto-4-pentenoate hydratase/2-oxohepta-3-ene-1,7-dioic acid hydratase in catechol pathway